MSSNMDTHNSEGIKPSDRGSPVWPEYPLIYTNGVVTPYHSPYHTLYPHGEQSPYDKNPIPPSPPFINVPFTEMCPSNMNSLRLNEDVHPSPSTPRYKTIYKETAAQSQEFQAYTKAGNIYDHNTATRDNIGITPASNVYTGVIKHSRFDFIAEDPQKKKSKKAIETPTSVEDTTRRRGCLPSSKGNLQRRNRNADDVVDKGRLDMSRTQLNTVTGSHDNEKHVDSCASYNPPSNQASFTTSGQLDSTGDSQRSTDTSSPSLPPADGADHFTSMYKLQYSWPGQSHHQERTSYESATPLETYVIERPTTDRNGPVPYTQSTSMTPMLPSINSFTGAFDQYGYRGMTCFPLMYPPGLPPYLQYYSMFPNTDPYYLLREHYKDKDPTMFPSFIQPKPSASSYSCKPFTETDQPPMPNPTAMFHAANVLPPFVASSSSPSRSTTSTSIEEVLSTARKLTLGATGYRHFNIQPKATSQAWLKGDTAYNYTVAAAPSEVMTYLPQTPREECDKDDTTDDEDSEEPYYCLAELAGKQDIAKDAAPPRKPHVCDICGKTYARAFTLKTHKRVHTGEKPYKCHICHKTFAQGGGLDSHMRVHTGDKPYKCPICSRAFSHSSAVKSHLRRHTGEKPFQCNVCHKRFSDQSTLKKHTRIHTGEKPFKCHICKVTFTQVGNMNKHVRNIHGNNEKISMTTQSTSLLTTSYHGNRKVPW